jgi:hypothetical protein
MPLPCIRIVTTPMVEQKLRALALKESRSVSQMGAILLAESIERRREASASTERIVRAIRGEANFSPDNAA